MDYHARRNVNGGAVHLATADGQVICGKQMYTVKMRLVGSPLEAADCAHCRRRAGLVPFNGTVRSRSSRGLDSSAWGANRGR